MRLFSLPFPQATTMPSASVKTQKLTTAPALQFGSQDGWDLDADGIQNTSYLSHELFRAISDRNFRRLNVLLSDKYRTTREHPERMFAAIAQPRGRHHDSILVTAIASNDIDVAIQLMDWLKSKNPDWAVQAVQAEGPSGRTAIMALGGMPTYRPPAELAQENTERLTRRLVEALPESKRLEYLNTMDDQGRTALRQAVFCTQIKASPHLIRALLVTLPPEQRLAYILNDPAETLIDSLHKLDRGLCGHLDSLMMTALGLLPAEDGKKLLARTIRNAQSDKEQEHLYTRYIDYLAKEPISTCSQKELKDSLSATFLKLALQTGQTRDFIVRYTTMGYGTNMDLARLFSTLSEEEVSQAMEPLVLKGETDKLKEIVELLPETERLSLIRESSLLKFAIWHDAQGSAMLDVLWNSIPTGHRGAAVDLLASTDPVDVLGASEQSAKWVLDHLPSDKRSEFLDRALHHREVFRYRNAPGYLYLKNEQQK